MKQIELTSKLVVALIAVTIVSGMTASAYAAAQTSTTVEKIPVDFNLFIPCVGEEVHLTGRLHLLIHVTLDNAGGAHVKLQENNQGVSGTGLTTGDKYQSTGASNSVFQFHTKVGDEQTFVFSFNFIGQGNGNKLLVHVTQHVTVNANGIVTAEVENISIECK
jgi:hypothetical protein